MGGLKMILRVGAAVVVALLLVATSASESPTRAAPPSVALGPGEYVLGAQVGSWSAPEPMASGVVKGGIAVDAADNWHLVYSDSSWVGEVQTSYIKYQSSSASGPVVLAQGTVETHAGPPWRGVTVWSPSIAVGPRGTLHVFYVYTEYAGGELTQPPRIMHTAQTPLHLEVTQATQTETNSVPLIQGKPTFVRVYVDCGARCAPEGETAIGVLRAYGPSGELRGSPLKSNNRSITAYREDWTSQRGDVTKTLNFTLPAEWRTGTVTFTAEVNISGVPQSGSDTLTFRSAATPTIRYVPILYQGKSPSLSRIYRGSWWAYRAYPAAGIRYVPGTTLQWTVPLPGTGAKSLLNELTTLYRTLDGYVYGWLPEGAYGGGKSDPMWLGGSGKAAFGDDHPLEGGRIFAHEIAHLMGRRHTNTGECGDADPRTDWPYSTAKIQEYGLDGYGSAWRNSSSQAIKDPVTTYDYMSYCGRLADSNVWTSPFTYEQVYSQALKLETAAVPAGSPSGSNPYFIASGLVYGSGAVALDPIWVITSTVARPNPPTGTQYCLEGHNASGATLVSRCFDLAFLDYETGQPTEVDGFNLMLSYPSGLARVVVKKGPSELGARRVTPNAPVVTLQSPNGGETWSATGTYTVTWHASDPDGDALTYRFSYSHDGTNWIPVSGIITDTRLTVSAAELPGGSTARIRVLASDGVNTTSDESDGPFSVGRKRPSVAILSPEGNTTVPTGTPLWLHGYAYDYEDGPLAGDALQWSSNRDGPLGTGSEPLVSLSPGQHVVTLRAWDSDGNVEQAQLTAYVGHSVYLPLVIKSYGPGW